MSNFNKVVTNLQQSLSNTENDNLSQTLSAVRTAGGGGGGGSSYGGDGTYIEIVGNNTITLTTTAAAQLNRTIPTTVAELTDSADYATKDFADNKYQPKVDMSAYLTTANAASTYQTIDGMNDYVGQQEYNNFKNTTNSNLNNKQNKLNFGYDENNAISSIDGHKLAGAGGVTGDYYSASNPSGFINSAQAETQILAKKYITSSVNELDNFYSKSQTSGAEEIANAIKDFVDTDLLETTSGDLKTWVSTNYYDKTETSSKTELQTKFNSLLDYDVTAAAGIEITTATDAGVKTFGISMTAEPVVTDTRISGYNGIAAALDTNVSGLWNVGLTQDMLDKVDAKLYSSAFEAISGNFVTASTNFTADLSQASKLVVNGSSKISASNQSELVLTNQTKLCAYNANFAQGTNNVIPSYDAAFAQGITNTANYQSLAQGLSNSAINNSIAQGLMNSASTYSQAFGYGNIVTNTGMAIGKYNKTSSDVSFVIGNGTSNARSDLFVIKQDGTVSSTGDIVTNNKSLSGLYDTVSSNSANWASSLTGVTANNGISGDGTNANKLGLETTAYGAVQYVTANSGNGDNVSAKLNTTDFNTYTATTAPATYQPKGDYLSSNALAGYATTALLDTISSKIENDIPTTVAQLTDSANYYTKSETSGATEISTALGNKVDKPTSLVDKYLVLRTDNAGNVSGWCDFQDQSYSKSEALGTFVATANIDTTTLSGDGKSVSTKLGVKTDVIATRDYVNSSFLPLSGGTVSGDVIVKSTGTNLLAVNTTATLMGQSRVANLTDTTAIGTNWLGVNANGGGFLKNVQGGNVGALNGTSIQINFAPNGNTAYGNITVNSQGNESKVVHVPTASYNSMSSFDNTNGPNYMLRKTASGFDIGAAVINVTALPSTTEANAYYFVYDL